MVALSLPPALDSGSVGPLRDSLLENRASELRIDGSAVQRCGGLGLQVLMAASRLWAAEGLAFTITPKSDALVEAMRLMGAFELSEFAQ